MPVMGWCSRVFESRSSDLAGAPHRHRRGRRTARPETSRQAGRRASRSEGSRHPCQVERAGLAISTTRPTCDANIPAVHGSSSICRTRCVPSKVKNPGPSRPSQTGAPLTPGPLQASRLLGPGVVQPDLPCGDRGPEHERPEHRHPLGKPSEIQLLAFTSTIAVAIGTLRFFLHQGTFPAPGVWGHPSNPRGRRDRIDGDK